MDARRIHYLRAMGVTTWISRTAAEPEPASVPDMPAPRSTDQAPLMLDGMDLDSLRAAVAECRRCPLHQSRTQTVFGVGSAEADLLIVGEAPGAEEDLRGEPFVGRAGQLLDAMLAAVRQSRSTAYIVNVLKCRPPNNRDPSAAEAACCAPYLQRQIELIQPRVILAVGRIAAHRLLDEDLPLGRMRGRLHTYGAQRIPLVVTYHPAYLLRRPSEKAKSWQDLLLAMSVFDGAAQ
ncbi:MAG: uracil-DNA glycosylase [Gammaproteobacteria bacterium]